jgi:hypothetical protein
LADAALAAGIEVQRYIEGKHSSLSDFRSFVSLLQEPITSNNSYKLLNDARNLPLYRAAYSNVFGSDTTKQSDVLLQEISTLLKDAEQKIPNKKPDREPIVRFCLALNRIFLAENARLYDDAYRARIKNATP